MREKNFRNRYIRRLRYFASRLILTYFSYFQNGGSFRCNDGTSFGDIPYAIFLYIEQDYSNEKK